jgi:mono/diheme cytochrome c family protein/glucose/arabinose dehydrogenase
MDARPGAGYKAGMPRLRILALATLRIVMPALLCDVAAAQSGDRAGEIQAPLPAHLKSPPAPALSAKDALGSFKLAPGFRIELVASEPLVFDPVAMSIGADGRLWVVEMRAFMQDVDGGNERAPIGTIAVLDDVDGDGRMDRRTEFAGGLVMPRALALVANGVLVAEPPNLWFFEDTNRDGKADRRSLVADDYGDASNPEHTANGLMWAMDNWIYSANHTTRFRFDRGRWRRENTAFRGQWGITQDDAGRLFYNSNSDPLRMDLLPAEYLRRNAHLVAPAGVNLQLARAQDVPVWPGRVTLGVNRGYRTLRADGTLPSVTAACGPVIYRGGTFPAGYHGNAFFAEPSANLVKRLVVESHDGVPSARNAYERTEFLTSTDERFRPVNLYNGPDGALYVVDLYRGIIQHRIYLTTYLRNQIQERGLAAPLGLGRIYRIVPDQSERYQRPTLGRASTRALVAALAHREAWWRDTAQRLLVERREPAATPALRELARRSPSARARLHALWTLEGLDAADWKSVSAGLADADVDVAIAATRLAERFFADRAADVLQAIEARGRWGEPAFLRQAALSLGAGRADAVSPALARLADQHGALPFMADAVASSLAGRELAMLERLAGSGTPGSRAVIRSLSSAILQSGNPENISRLWSRLAGGDVTPELADALLDGVERFIPGEAARRRAVFLPAEPRALVEFSKGGTPQAARAADALKFLRWRGQRLDRAAALASLTPAERQRFERGRQEFAVCAACHQPDGEGMAGLAPALQGSPWVTGGVGALARIVLNGKSGGELSMPPLRTLDDEAIAAVLTYLRRSWGHESSAVAVDQVQAIRAETAEREEPWTEAELQPFD